MCDVSKSCGVEDNDLGYFRRFLIGRIDKFLRYRCDGDEYTRGKLVAYQSVLDLFDLVFYDCFPPEYALDNEVDEV